MKLKRFLSLLLIFCMIFSFVACGNRNSDGDDDSSQSSYQKDDEDNDDNDNDADTEKEGKKDPDNNSTDEKNDDKSPSDVEKDHDVFDEYEKVDFPTNYPKDAYPVYKNSKIWYAISNKNDELNVFSINVISKDSVEKVSSYYLDLVRNAEDFKDSSIDKVFMYTGIHQGYEFTISCSADDSNKNYTQYTIMLTEVPTVAAILEKLNYGELPDDYPKDKFPLMEDAAIYDASENEYDGLVSYSISLFTDKSFKEIIGFYENALNDITDKSKSSSTDEFSLTGIAQGYEFSIWGNKTDRDNVELVQYWINLNPITD